MTWVATRYGEERLTADLAASPLLAGIARHLLTLGTAEARHTAFNEAMAMHNLTAEPDVVTLVAEAVARVEAGGHLPGAAYVKAQRERYEAAKAAKAAKQDAK